MICRNTVVTAVVDALVVAVVDKVVVADDVKLVDCVVAVVVAVVVIELLAVLVAVVVWVEYAQLSNLPSRKSFKAVLIRPAMLSHLFLSVTIQFPFVSSHLKLLVSNMALTLASPFTFAACAFSISRSKNGRKTHLVFFDAFLTAMSAIKFG